MTFLWFLLGLSFGGGIASAFWIWAASEASAEGRARRPLLSADLPPERLGVLYCRLYDSTRDRYSQTLPLYRYESR